MPRILFVAAHRPDRSPSQRFRFEQYLDHFRQNGYECDLSYIIRGEDDTAFYSPGHFFSKLAVVVRSWQKRRRDVRSASRYDIVFVQREAFMTGSSYFERQFAKRTKLVFDFDDALWLMDISEGNRRFGWLKNPDKTRKIIAVSHLVIAGNKYLADYARRYNSNVVMIPTTIDTGYHRKVFFPKPDDRICIGWTGSLTTIKHFEYAVPFLKALREKYRDHIYFKVIGDAGYRNSELGIQGVAWNAATEIADLSEIDIGIMPLPDDEWAKGKCGLKALSYMAMEIPAVLSPVGVNAEIISDGENGFLARENREWVEKLSRLIESKELRERLGQKGRRTVEERYSVSSQKQIYLEHFGRLLAK
ncbi:MAG: glycosyltransferase family 4 protein [Bacteroidota bacterium]